MTWILRARCEARGCNCSTAVDEATCTIRTTCLSCRWSRKAAFATGRIASRRRGSPIPSPCELTIRLLRCAVREPSWRTTTGYPPSSPARTRYACRHRKLPHMTHRVLRPVHEAADDGRRELRPTHAPKIAERRDVDRAELGHGGLDPCVQRIEYGRDVGGGEWLAFRAKGRE